MRKLASVQRVEAILPIEGADRIELARIGGWHVVVKKGEFVVNDLGVFFEIDAVPPDTDTYRFLWQSNKTTEPTPRPGNFRLKTKKMRGALSQGLLMPLAALFGGPNIKVGETFFGGVEGTSSYVRAEEGLDVTEILGVEKYEAPDPKVPGSKNHARRVSNFPGHLVPKTDEERVQSAKRVLVDLAGKPWVATMKCDGMSATYLIDDGVFRACSRNYMVEVTEENAWGRMAIKYDLERKIGEQMRYKDLAIQAEVVGPTAQGNPMALAEDELRIFSVYDTANKRYLSHRETREVAEALGVPAVDVLFEGDAFYPELVGLTFDKDDAVTFEENGRKITRVLEDLLAKAEGKYPNSKHEREGLVIRPRDEELFSPALRSRLSFKVISNRFLLAEKD